MLSRSVIFGQNLRIIRETMELTQEEAAEKCGLSIAQYNRTELGNTSIDLDRIAHFASTFKVSEEELLTGVFSAHDDADDLERMEILNAISIITKNLSVSDLRFLFKIVQSLFQYKQDIEK